MEVVEASCMMPNTALAGRQLSDLRVPKKEAILTCVKLHICFDIRRLRLINLVISSSSIASSHICGEKQTSDTVAQQIQPPPPRPDHRHLSITKWSVLVLPLTERTTLEPTAVLALILGAPSRPTPASHVRGWKSRALRQLAAQDKKTTA